MIYSLYHWYTDTHMNDNGMPVFVDILGGLLDALIIFGILAVWSHFASGNVPL